MAMTVITAVVAVSSFSSKATKGLSGCNGARGFVAFGVRNDGWLWFSDAGGPLAYWYCIANPSLI